MDLNEIELEKYDTTILNSQQNQNWVLKLEFALL